MSEHGNPKEATLIRRSEVEPDLVVATPKVRDLTPADGSVVISGQLVSVFCAPCQRWIDCHAGISSEIALDRHADLLH
jgi:hypothetical protein